MSEERESPDPGPEEEPSRGIRGTFLAACEALDEADVPFVIVGGFAVSAWGTPRTTEDVDVVLEASPAEAAEVAAEMGARDLALLERDLVDAIEDGTHATAFDERSGIYHVDLRPATDPDTRRTLADRRHVEVAGRSVPVASPEETVAHKLLYASEQDLEDAEGVYVRQAGSLDEAHLEARCEDLGVLDELHALRDRVDADGDAGSS